MEEKQTSPTKPEPTVDGNTFELYKHIKENIKNVYIHCKDPISPDSFYCENCKVSTCPHCTNFNSHNGHNLINKTPYYHNSQELIDEQFEDLENIFNMNPEYLDVNKTRGDFKNYIETEINKLISSLQTIKDAKLQEVDTLFSESDNCVNNLKNQVALVKKNIFEFFKNQKTFFNIDLEKSADDVNGVGGESGDLNFKVQNKDFCNLIFLLNYDMQNTSKIKNKSIINLIESIKEMCSKYQNLLNERVNAVNEAVERLREPFKENLYYIQLSQDHYKEINEKIKKYTNEIKNIQQTIFDSVKKTGALDEIDKKNCFIEAKHKQNIEFVLKSEKFESQNPIHSIERGFKPKMKHFGFGVRRTMSDERTESNIPMSLHAKYQNPSDINLNSLVVQKYFTYVLLDLIRKDFHQGKKGVADSMFEEEVFDEDFDVAKPVPGTNEMLVYDKKTRVLVKKKVQFDKNDHQYNYFLTGCRCVLIKDKLFITGGIDKSSKESKICYIYEIKSNELNLMPDMLNARAYHSVQYLESFKCILAVGGENNNSCELYDVYNYKWISLPKLNFPRAHSCLYLDRLTNIIYSCFGIVGNMSDANTYTDIMECLQLKRISLGWGKVEYKNKTDMDFSNRLCRIFPINEEKLLIYGASPVRESKKSGAIFVISKSEIVKIDKNTFKVMRVQARKSIKLNKIISSLA